MREIKPIKHLNATVRIPGSKSYTHRALIISSLAKGRSVLINPLKCDDTDYTANALIGFGVPLFWDGDRIEISGLGGLLLPPKERIYVGNSGTSLRFLTAIASLIKGRTILEGSSRMKSRPIDGLLEALRLMGIKAHSEEKRDLLMVSIESEGLNGGYIKMGGQESSQFISALLMIAPYAHKKLEIEVSGDLVSRPYVDITIDTMSAFGVKIMREGYRYFSIREGVTYSPCKFQIESDASNASYFFSAAAITGGKVRIEKFNPDSLQGDIGFLRILEEMGCKVIRGEDWVEVQGAKLRGIEIDMRKMPDVVPTLAVTSSFARGKTVIKNIGHLRYKESDRITAIANELKKMGIDVEVGNGSLIIRGGSAHGADIETYNDHRMAMSFAIAGLVVPGIRILGGQCVSKSFPTFWKTLEALY